MADGVKRRVGALKEKVRLHGDEANHEQTDYWSNRDLIPLPPNRRTWGWFSYFGFWTLSSLNITNWQTPNTFLTQGLSVGQSMVIIVLGRFFIVAFSTLIAWCGLEWHIGFTVQNRYTWGMRGSFIPLLQRILLNFIWNAVQCWNGGRLAAVCLTAIWPSYAKMKNFLPASMPTDGGEFIGFLVFWLVSAPFLWIRPESFKIPFFITSIYCGCAMFAIMVWALVTAKGVGPLMYTGVTATTKSEFNDSWLIMAGINTMLGNIAAGITNGSDFSRYSRNRRSYVIGSVISCWVVGVIVSIVGLVTTSAAQKIYGEVIWNPPDLLLAMMNNGDGSSASRAAVFFLAFGFALVNIFENICGNAVAGGIDLAGLFPRYIDIRRGAIITFLAAWVVQPWQLVNRATTFVQVLSSFSVFLAPIIGMMTVDYYLLRKRRIQLSHLYRTHETAYWYWHGVNWRAIPAWLLGWAPTVGGLIVTVRGDADAPRALKELYYMAFFLGFFISGLLFYALNLLFPPGGLGVYEEPDVYGTFTAKEAARLGVIPTIEAQAVDNYTSYATEEAVRKK